MNDTDRVLSLQDVRFGYPRSNIFLGPASFDIRPGSIWGVVGPNGAGKSTLLRLCAGLLMPTSGTVRWAGRPLADMPARKRAEHIAFLPQRTEASLWCTARQVALLGRFPHQRHRYFESAADVRIADDALRTTETLDLADRSMDTLSGGEAQRVHLAAALAQQPDLLILDEPTASLDIFHLWRLARILRQLRDNAGPSILLATHDLNLAFRLCDYLLLIHNGTLTHTGTPRDVLTPDALEAAYHVPFRVIHSDGQSWIVPASDFGLGDTDPAGALTDPTAVSGPHP